MCRFPSLSTFFDRFSTMVFLTILILPGLRYNNCEFCRAQKCYNKFIYSFQKMGHRWCVRASSVSFRRNPETAKFTSKVRDRKNIQATKRASRMNKDVYQIDYLFEQLRKHQETYKNSRGDVCNAQNLQASQTCQHGKGVRFFSTSTPIAPGYPTVLLHDVMHHYILTQQM